MPTVTNPLAGRELSGSTWEPMVKAVLIPLTWMTIGFILAKVITSKKAA
jgi:hypothetical protein